MMETLLMLTTVVLLLLLLLCPVHGLRRGVVHPRALANDNDGMMVKMTNYDDDPLRAGGKGSNKGGNKGDDEEQCDSESQTIVTSIIVNLAGIRPQDVDETRKSALEQAFLLAYNRLLLERCPGGGSFREILTVTLDLDLLTLPSMTSRRQLMFSGGGFPFNVVWGCNDRCPRDAKLLGNDAGRRVLLVRQLQDDLDRGGDDDDDDEGNDNSCLPCDTPTSPVFLVSYNDVIDEFEEELGITIATAVAATELELVQDCILDDVSRRQSFLTVPFAGDPDQATEQELALVAEAALQSLNNLNVLNPETCDSFFRVVISVEATVNRPVDGDASRRALQFNRNGGGVVLNIVWSCRNTCPDSARLLRNDAGRRRRRVQTTDATIRSLQTEPEECLCPVGALEFLPPTQDEFDQLFNQTLTVLIDDDEVTFIDQIGDSTESEEIQCPTDVDVRSTQLAVEVDAEPASVEEADIAILANIIILTYTDLTTRLCNPEVRTIIEVVFVRKNEVDLSDANSTTRKLMFKGTSVVYNIVFNCPRCPKGAGVTGNDAGRRLASVDWIPTRSLQDIQGERCFCDIDFLQEARPPTEEEFSVALSRAIDDSDQLNFTSTGVTETLATPAPVTSSPITPAPIATIIATPAPVTPSPTTSAPATSAPITSVPITSAPITPAPTTASPVTVAPITDKPSTTAPVTPRPITASPVSPEPTMATTLEVDIEYDIAVANDSNSSFAADLVASMDLLAAQVASQTFARARRRLIVSVQPPSSLKDVLETDCPQFVPPDDTCRQIVHTIFVQGTGNDTTFDVEQFRIDLFQAIVDGQLQDFLDMVNTESTVYIVTGLTAPDPVTPAPVAPTNAPVTPQPVTPSPVMPTDAPVSSAPVVVDGTNERQICSKDPSTGTITCECRPGWMGENGCFSDIPECLTGVCEFPGGFCVEKNGDEGMYECGCGEGFQSIDGQSDSHGPTACQRENPCEDTNAQSLCHMDATCMYAGEPLMFTCQCNPGFEGDGFVDCQPLPEEALTAPPTMPPTLQPTIANCDNGGVECPTGHRCDTTSSSEPTCICLDGFSSLNEGVSACSDDNECSDPAIHRCDEFATCSNIPGSFFCECNEGYVDAPGSLRVGTDCILRNECEDPMLNTCDPVLEVCVDRPPPTFFECVTITPAPTPPPTEPPTLAPTNPPTNPPTCRLENQSCPGIFSTACCAGLTCQESPCVDVSDISEGSEGSEGSEPCEATFDCLPCLELDSDCSYSGSECCGFASGSVDCQITPDLGEEFSPTCKSCIAGGSGGCASASECCGFPDAQCEENVCRRCSIEFSECTENDDCCDSDNACFVYSSSETAGVGSERSGYCEPCVEECRREEEGGGEGGGGRDEGGAGGEEGGAGVCGVCLHSSECCGFPDARCLRLGPGEASLGACESCVREGNSGCAPSGFDQNEFCCDFPQAACDENVCVPRDCVVTGCTGSGSPCCFGSCNTETGNCSRE